MKHALPGGLVLAALLAASLALAQPTGLPRPAAEPGAEGGGHFRRRDGGDPAPERDPRGAPGAGGRRERGGRLRHRRLPPARRGLPPGLALRGDVRPLLRGGNRDDLRLQCLLGTAAGRPVRGWQAGGTARDRRHRKRARIDRRALRHEALGELPGTRDHRRRAGRPGHELPVREQLQPLGERGPDPGERGGAGLLHARGSPGPGRRDLEDAGARRDPARRRRARRRPPLQGRVGEEVRGTGDEPRLLRHPRRPRGVRDALARAGALHLPGPRDPRRAAAQQGRPARRAEPERIGAVRPDGHGSLRRVPGDPRDHGPELRQGGVGHEVVHPGPGGLPEPLRTLELEGVRAAERRVRPADHAAAGGGPDGDDGEGSGAERTLPPR